VNVARGMLEAPFRLAGTVQHYEWGDQRLLPDFLGQQPDGRPWAEWWVGAHPQAPSPVLTAPGTRLDQLIRRDPLAVLGGPVCDQFGARLPFLLKVLAVARPLSLQVHPTDEQASAGFHFERQGLESAPAEPLYADEWAKPEMLLAVTQFEAFAGLVTPEQAWDRLAPCAGPTLSALMARHLDEPTPSGLARLVNDLLRLDEDVVRLAVAELSDGMRAQLATEPDETGRRTTIARLAAEFPADPAVAVVALMRHVVLAPGDALAVPAGLLHCYTRGLAVEIQGTSNNTLRAGLTTKRVDVEEVLRIVDPNASPRHVTPTQPNVGLRRYVPGLPAFALDAVDLVPSTRVPVPPGLPAVVVTMRGTVDLDAGGTSTQLRRGEAAFVPASVCASVLLSGEGQAVVGYPGLAPLG